ncbi:hypothetical protein H5J24_17985 [Chryseobacterium capnotolerans]|uniref:hypothetical protein n=1 Tax=Chryseobacterium TaxID=59732 RepID=UPI00083B8AA0|nr:MULTISPECIES: hypothetical protein [Chryseobacterium]UHO37553.1 hypothetical protein H5J24_17985 [Chryseobacterium capnotolerans]
MKSALHLLFLLCWSVFFSQQAITNEGKEVMLLEDKTWKSSRGDLGNFSTMEAFTAGDQKVIIFSDNTWKFMNKATESLYENTVINSTAYTNPKTASSLAQSKRANAGFYYDPKKWTVLQEQHEYSRGEFELQGVLNKDMFASFGSFPLENNTTLKNVKDIVLTSFLMNPSHYKIKRTEFRTVNGTEMFYIKYHDIDLDYDIIHYYVITGDKACAQISAGSPEKQFTSSEKDLQDFLNGLIKVKTEKYVEQVNTQAPVPSPPRKQN